MIADQLRATPVIPVAQVVTASTIAPAVATATENTEPTASSENVVVDQAVATTRSARCQMLTLQMLIQVLYAPCSHLKATGNVDPVDSVVSATDVRPVQAADSDFYRPDD